jgi:endonuclease III
MAKQTQAQRLDALLEVAGTTLSEQAGIRLRDQPAPLFQLVVLASLLAKPISGDVAVAACRELIEAGLTTPQKMQAASWQHRVDVLGRAHYRRYDESTATRLDEAARLIIERYRGDLRRLAEASGHDRDHTVELLEEIPGIGPTGASIFLREAQVVWPWAGPYFDERALAGAKKLDLPSTAAELARLTVDRDRAHVAAALVRADLDDSIPGAVRSLLPAR